MTCLKYFQTDKNMFSALININREKSLYWNTILGGIKMLRSALIIIVAGVITCGKLGVFFFRFPFSFFFLFFKSKSNTVTM